MSSNGIIDLMLLRRTLLSGREKCQEYLLVANLIDPANAGYTETTVREVGRAARAIRLQIQVLKASTIREINAAFATLAARPIASAQNRTNALQQKASLIR